MTRLLASVADHAEALAAAAAGADIVDLKNPAAGALGALSPVDAARIVLALRGGPPVSATVGDLPMDTAIVVPAVAAMAGTGVDYVKIGFFPGGDWEGVIDGLSAQRCATRLIAVFFGDALPSLRWLDRLSRAGFAGAMLDTMDKSAGSLTSRCELRDLEAFVDAARRLGLLCGLAGSLRSADIPVLLRLGPDYLGFRGALCEHGRTGRLNPAAIRTLAAQIHKPQFMTVA